MNVQITNPMLFALIINMVYAKAIGLTQGIMEREVGNDIWIATILSTLQGVVIILITIYAIRRMPKKNIVELASELLGKWVGKVIGLAVFIYFIGANGGVMITFVYHLRDYFLPELPIFVFVVAVTVVTIFSVYHGLEVTARIAIVGVFSVVLLNVLLMMGTIKDFDIDLLKPAFQSGILPTLWASRHADTDWTMATMVTGMILPFVADKKKWAKSSAGGILSSGILIVLWPILECGVMSAPETGHYIVACMQMARSAEIGWFIHRYEMIMVAFFAISLLVQLMMILFCSSIAVSQTLGMKDYRPVVVPVAIFLAVAGYFVVVDHNRALMLLSVYWPPSAIGIAVGIPTLLFVIGFFMKKKIARKIQMEPSLSN